MKKAYIVLLTLITCFTACVPTDDINEYSDYIDGATAKRTILLYFPYTGDIANLSSYLLNNVEDLEQGIIDEGGIEDSTRVLVFMATSSTQGSLFRIRYENGSCRRDTLRNYDSDTFNARSMNSQSWLKYLFNQVASYAPADSFAMCVGGHGMGWIPKSIDSALSTRTALKSVKTNSAEDESPLTTYYRPMPNTTRWWGGTGDVMTEVATLDSAIRNSNIGKLQYLILDMCYMSNIETVYELKDAASYIIASPTEISGVGIPYDKVWKYLYTEPLDYTGFVDDYYADITEYTTQFGYPYCQLCVVNTSHLDSLANIMRSINANDTIFDSTYTDSLQYYDGNTPKRFFDLVDYVDRLCTSDSLKTLFKNQMDLVVPYKRTTAKAVTALTFPSQYFDINKYSGLSISDPTENSSIQDVLNTTSWYKATH